MNSFTFLKHDKLNGCHAPFSASQNSWLRYSDEKALEYLKNKKAAELGTKLHAFAKDAIDLGIRQQKSKKTLNMYINDAIGYKMSTEVVLFHSENFFGTADAISFKNGFLRIHDLKTGKTPVHMEQLMIYAALFCLEYKIKPNDIEMELRIYQNDEVIFHNPEPDEIIHIIDKIIHLDNLISKYKEV
jgi:hypothetical protein